MFRPNVDNAAQLIQNIFKAGAGGDHFQRLFLRTL
jgi:hypothetical protein